MILLFLLITFSICSSSSPKYTQLKGEEVDSGRRARSRSLVRLPGDLLGQYLPCCVFQRYAMALRHFSPRKIGKTKSRKKWAVVRCLVFACAVFLVYLYISYGYAVMGERKCYLNLKSTLLQTKLAKWRGHLLRGKAVQCTESLTCS